MVILCMTYHKFLRNGCYFKASKILYKVLIWVLQGYSELIVFLFYFIFEGQGKQLEEKMVQKLQQDVDMEDIS